jgi:hypothetical protein
MGVLNWPLELAPELAPTEESVRRAVELPRLFHQRIDSPHEVVPAWICMKVDEQGLELNSE